MRKPIIAGNWKMNKTVAETLELVRDIRQLLVQAPENVEVVLCPPFTALWVAKNGLGRSQFSLGAQNLYHEPKGAFTGEISPAMLAELVTYVIIGHSERRQYFSRDGRVREPQGQGRAGERPQAHRVRGRGPGRIRSGQDERGRRTAGARRAGRA